MLSTYMIMCIRISCGKSQPFLMQGLHGSRLSDQAASVTPVLPGTAVGPASETETEASRAHSVMPPLITAEQNTCLTVVPDPPCMPAPDTSPLFHNTYELQYADGSITGDASVHASLSIPAISPSMLFSVPPPTMVCHHWVLMHT